MIAWLAAAGLGAAGFALGRSARQRDKLSGSSEATQTPAQESPRETFFFDVADRAIGAIGDGFDVLTGAGGSDSDTDCGCS